MDGINEMQAAEGFAGNCEKTACDLSDPLARIRRRLFGKQEQLKQEHAANCDVLRDFEDPTVQKVLRVLRAVGVI